MHEELKAWLLRYRDAAKDADTLTARSIELRARAEAARTSRLDGMPHANGYAGDAVGVSLSRIDALEQEAQEARSHARDLYRQIDATIKKITGPGWADKRAVLQVRYLDLEKWEGVSEVLFGRRDDYEDRQESFLRRVHKIHGAALAELSKYVPLNEGQEIRQDREDMK